VVALLAVSHLLREEIGMGWDDADRLAQDIGGLVYGTETVAVPRASLELVLRTSQASGHCHQYPGVWDDGEHAGWTCTRCAAWNEIAALLEMPPVDHERYRERVRP
jgi:hypothetical protein